MITECSHGSTQHPEFLYSSTVRYGMLSVVGFLCSNVSQTGSVNSPLMWALFFSTFPGLLPPFH